MYFRSFLGLLYSIVAVLAPTLAHAQLKLYGGRQNDNNCKVFFLVNPTDSIYYIAGLQQNQLSDCQTFSSKIMTHSGRLRINVSINEEAYLLLLPKDTIAYKILISANSLERDMEMQVLLRHSTEVINTNNDKKRNRQIKRLDGRTLILKLE